MSQLLNNPSYCRERADAMRSLTSRMIDTESKAFMLALAAKYDELAERAAKQRRDYGGESPTS